MSVRLIKRACLVLKPHPGGKAVRCAVKLPGRCLPDQCIWARWHQLPADSPMRRKRTLTVKLERA